MSIEKRVLFPISTALLAASIDRAEAGLFDTVNLDCENLPGFIEVMEDRPANEQIAELLDTYNVSIHFSKDKQSYNLVIDQHLLECTESKPLQLAVDNLHVTFSRPLESDPLADPQADYHFHDLAESTWLLPAMRRYSQPDSKQSFWSDDYTFYPVDITDNMSGQSIQPLHLQSALGSINLDNYLYYQPHQPFFRSEAGYYFYDFRAHNFYEHRNHHKLQAVSEQMQAAEAFFTDKPTSLIKGVDILWQGLSSAGIDEVFYLGEDRLKGRIDILQAVVRHEVYHTIISANKHSFFQKRSALNERHQELWRKKSKLFQLVNENNFYEFKIDNFGHTQDNSNELIASILNSLHHPDWEKKMKDLAQEDPETFQDYLDFLRLFREELLAFVQEDSSLGFNEQARIFSYLQEKIDYLTSLQNPAN